MRPALNVYWRAGLLRVDFVVADFFAADFFAVDFLVVRFFDADFVADGFFIDDDVVDDAFPCISSSRACNARLPSPRSCAITASRS